MVFEIVRGDYGRVYRGIIKGEDLSDCTAVIYVWDSNNNKVIDGKPCSVSYVPPDTYVEYTVEPGDFDVEPGIYYGLIKFMKEGVVERTLPFTWKVYRREP